MYIICPSRKYELDITKGDREIIRLIAQRQDYARKIAKIKIHEGIPVHDEHRTGRGALNRSLNWQWNIRLIPWQFRKFLKFSSP